MHKSTQEGIILWFLKRNLEALDKICGNYVTVKEFLKYETR
jgi:hypothetical protein